MNQFSFQMVNKSFFSLIRAGWSLFLKVSALNAIMFILLTDITLTVVGYLFHDDAPYLNMFVFPLFLVIGMYYQNISSAVTGIDVLKNLKSKPISIVKRTLYYLVPMTVMACMHIFVSQLWGLLFIFPGIIFLNNTVVSMQVWLDTQEGWFRSWRKSKELVSGKRWNVFWTICGAYFFFLLGIILCEGLVYIVYSSSSMIPYETFITLFQQNQVIYLAYTHLVTFVLFSLLLFVAGLPSLYLTALYEVLKRS